MRRKLHHMVSVCTKNSAYISNSSRSFVNALYPTICSGVMPTESQIQRLTDIYRAVLMKDIRVSENLKKRGLA